MSLIHSLIEIRYDDTTTCRTKKLAVALNLVCLKYCCFFFLLFYDLNINRCEDYYGCIPGEVPSLGPYNEYGAKYGANDGCGIPCNPAKDGGKFGGNKDGLLYG